MAQRMGRHFREPRPLAGAAESTDGSIRGAVGLYKHIFTTSRALMVEVRKTNGTLTVWWPNEDQPRGKPERPLARSNSSLLRTREPLASCAVLRFPPTIRRPARPRCPSRFVPTVASPCNAPSHTTLDHSSSCRWHIFLFLVTGRPP